MTPLPSPRATRCPHTAAGIAACLLTAASAAAQPPQDPSLAERVPADVGLFVEARGAGDLLQPLTEPQIWSTLAELAGQPAEPADVAEWTARIRRTIHMEPAEAIRVLLARQVAFVGPAPGRSPDAVALCRPAGQMSLPELLARWKARPIALEGAPAYQLAGGVAVAVLEDALAFGDPRQPDGMLRSLARARFTPEQPALAHDPAFAALLRRVPPQPTALLFARLARPTAPIASTASVPTHAPGSAPAAPLTATAPAQRSRAARNLLIAMHRQERRLRFSIVSDAQAHPPSAAEAPQALLLPQLPADTLAAWQGRIDPRRIAAALRALPPQHVLRVVLNLLEQRGSTDRLLGALDGEFCLALGTVRPPGRPEGAPPVPALALLAVARDELTAARETNALFEAVVTVHDFLSLARGLPPLPRSRETPIAGVPAVVLDLSQLISPQDGGLVGELHLCWTVHEHLLMIATHANWLEAILRSSGDEQPHFQGTLALDADSLPGEFDNLLALDSVRTCAVGRQWLSYLERTNPAVLEESWWRQRQPGGGEVTLGIEVVPEVEARRLRVASVQEDGPSAGFLRAGDSLVGAEKRRFGPGDLVAQIRTAIRQRPHARWVELLRERDGVISVVRIPVPFVNPVQVLRQFLALGGAARRLVYYDTSVDPAGPFGLLTVDLLPPADASAPQPPAASQRQLEEGR